MYALKAKNSKPPKGIAQGDGNGLCGIYIWLNAMDYFSNGALKRNNTLLESAFEALAKYAADTLHLNFFVAGEGLDHEDVVRCQVPASQFTAKHFGFEMSCTPFDLANIGDDFNALYHAMQKTLKSNNALLLLGLENYHHYTLAHSLSRTHIRLIDSYGMRSIPKAQSGGLKSKHTFNLDPNELVLIFRK